MARWPAAPAATTRGHRAAGDHDAGAQQRLGGGAGTDAKRPWPLTLPQRKRGGADPASTQPRRAATGAGSNYDRQRPGKWQWQQCQGIRCRMLPQGACRSTTCNCSGAKNAGLAYSTLTLPINLAFICERNRTKSFWSAWCDNARRPQTKH